MSKRVYPSTGGPPGPQGPQGPSGVVTFAEVEINLGSLPVRGGCFDITGTGFTVGKNVAVTQSVGPYTGKGTRIDEAEMDQIAVMAKVTSSTNIRCCWRSATAVKGYFKFHYVIGA